jgi:hypothetical protein
MISMRSPRLLNDTLNPEILIPTQAPLIDIAVRTEDRDLGSSQVRAALISLIDPFQKFWYFHFEQFTTNPGWF